MSDVSILDHDFDSSDLLALPVMPIILEKLLESIKNDKINFQQLARLVGYDVTLSARMLTAANSAVCGRRVLGASSLERALTVLGRGTAKTVIATTAIHQSFSQSHGIPASDLECFWRHSLTCAFLARRLATIIAYPEPDEAYLCGLLHDIGKLVIGVRHTRLFQEIHAFALLLGEIPALERRLFGIDHCELGAALVETWKLRSFLADAIRFHHLSAAELRGTHPLLRLLHIANALSQEEELRQAAIISADTLFSLPPALVNQVRAEVDREVAELVVDLGIAVPSIGKGDTIAAPALVYSPLDQAVRERVLISEAQTEIIGIDDEPVLLDSIARCATVLFDLTEVHAFPYDPKIGVLRVHELDQPLQEIVIDPAGAANAISRALRERQISYSLDEKTAKVGVIDRQLSRLWQTDGVLCLPLYTDSQVLGGLGVGISRAQLPRLLAQARLLRLFATVAAAELGKLRERETRQHLAQEDRFLLEQQHLRTVLHEVSNPLTVVRNYLHVLDARLGPGPSVAQEELKVLREETERISRILINLADSSGIRSEENSSFDLNRTIRELGRVLDEALCRPHGIGLNLNLMDGLPPLARGHDTIRQVLLNLVRNSVEAIEARGSGGVITVTTQDRVNLQGRQYVEMTVTDDGPGLPDDLRAKLFQPIASMKGGGHAGLGLATVKSVIEGLGGYVIYRPNNGGGVMFLVLLPQA